jgi:hypothetical protein
LLADASNNVLFSVNNSGSITSSIIYGGSAAGSTLTLQSTSNVSPSADTVIVNQGGLTRATFQLAGATSSGLDLNQNASASLPAQTNSGVRLTLIDSGFGGYSAYAFAANAFNVLARANGTMASPTKLVTNNNLGLLGFRGYDASPAWSGNQAAINAVAAEDWNDATHRGTNITISTTPSASGTLTQAVEIFASGGMAVGTTTDPGIGSIILNGTATITTLATDNTHTSRTVCQDTTTKLLLFGSGAVGICLGTSGEQFKTAFAPMKAGLDELMQIKMQNYRYLSGYGDGGYRIQYGPTAQAVEAVLPDLVGRDNNGETINYDWGALLFVGLHAIQQLKADNDNIELRLEKLERRIAR